MKQITRILALVMAIAMMLTLVACGGQMPADSSAAFEPTSAPEPTVSAEPTDPCKTSGHSWQDANYEIPKTCQVCGTTEGEPKLAYFAEHGLEEWLADKAAQHELLQTCGTDTEKMTVLQVSVEDYKTFDFDETFEAAEGYEWKTMTIRMRLCDENAQLYGINTWNYIWDSFYESSAADLDLNIDGLFEDGMAYPITWNDTLYSDGMLRIMEESGAWEQDQDGNYYLDIHVTACVRVPVGYDGFVFGLESYGWEIADGQYLYEAVTDNTLLFRFD